MLFVGVGVVSDVLELSLVLFDDNLALVFFLSCYVELVLELHDSLRQLLVFSLELELHMSQFLLELSFE